MSQNPLVQRLAPIKAFDVDQERGFLPASDPLQVLPPAFAAWEQASRELPKLLVSDRLRHVLGELPVLENAPLQTQPELERAMLLLSYFGHAYVWGEQEPADRLPASIALPWHQVASRLGRPAVLSYASYALWNWKRIDAGGPLALGNIALLQNFLGGLDEEWFILVHVDIEKRAAQALTAIPQTLDAVAAGEVQALVDQLSIIAAALDQMNRTLSRMPEHCDPYIYYRRVRPYIHGWKDNPALPQGVIYEGVAELGGQPQRLRGETGAQSAIIPSLDALLGIAHEDDPLRHYLNEMRDYMPPKHRAFIAAIEQHGSIRDFIQQNHRQHPVLRELYNQCIEAIQHFRATHLQYAAAYIESQKETSPANPTQVGTGGTPFMVYLKKHRDETRKHLIER